MERYRDLKEMLHAELERIQTKGELDMSILEQIDKLAHSLKDILTVEAMEDAGYSERYSMNYRGGAYDDRGRGPRASRDTMGRYSSEMRRGSYDDGMDSYRNR